MKWCCAPGLVCMSIAYESASCLELRRHNFRFRQLDRRLQIRHLPHGLHLAHRTHALRGSACYPRSLTNVNEYLAPHSTSSGMKALQNQAKDLLGLLCLRLRRLRPRPKCIKYPAIWAKKIRVMSKMRGGPCPRRIACHSSYSRHDAHGRICRRIIGFLGCDAGHTLGSGSTD